MSILCQSIECLPNTCGVFVDETSFSFADNRTTVGQCSKKKPKTSVESKAILLSPAKSVK